MKNIPLGFVPVEADYVHPGFAELLKRRPKYFRFDKGESRFYFTIGPRKKMNAHISITSLADHILPKGIGFHNWLKKHGDDSERIKYEKSVFGSVFHREALRPIRKDHFRHLGGYDFDYLNEVTAGQFYVSRSGDTRKCTNYHMLFPVDMRAKADEWELGFKKGLIAWFTFVRERIEWIEYMEGPIGVAKNSVAGTPDLVAGVRFDKKIERAIIDIKSFTMEGKVIKKTFVDSHEFQLEGLKYMWNTNFPNHPVELLFNWAPNDWKGTPTWEFKNQTGNKFGKTSRVGGKEITLFELYLQIAKMEGITIPPQEVFDIHGKFTDMGQFDFEQHWTKISLFNQ